MSAEADFRYLIGPGRIFETCVLINLDSRPDRLERSMSELAGFRLDGSVSRLRAVEHPNPMYGCSLSHVVAVKYAKQNGYSSLLILEDDIKIADDFGDRAPSVISDLASRNWGLFQFGAMFYHGIERLERVSEHLFKCRDAQGAHAVALRQPAFDIILDDYACELDRGNWDEPQHYPFDEYVNNVLPNEVPAFGSVRLLISQHAGYSDIRGEEADYSECTEAVYERLEDELSLSGGLRSSGVENRDVFK